MCIVLKRALSRCVKDTSICVTAGGELLLKRALRQRSGLPFENLVHVALEHFVELPPRSTHHRAGGMKFHFDTFKVSLLIIKS